MKTRKLIHPVYSEWKRMKKKGISIREMIGKYQYIFSSKKGEISLIELKDYLPSHKILWEIYCIKGNLFEDTKRFKTKEDAVKEIKKLLK